jgi:hypothetical protein
MLHEIEEHHNPMGIKGIGELGICGVRAAVADDHDDHNATGARFAILGGILGAVVATLILHVAANIDAIEAVGYRAVAKKLGTAAIRPSRINWG